MVDLLHERALRSVASGGGLDVDDGAHEAVPRRVPRGVVGLVAVRVAVAGALDGAWTGEDLREAGVACARVSVKA